MWRSSSSSLACPARTGFNRRHTSPWSQMIDVLQVAFPGTRMGSREPVRVPGGRPDAAGPGGWCGVRQGVSGGWLNVTPQQPPSRPWPGHRHGPQGRRNAPPVHSQGLLWLSKCLADYAYLRMLDMSVLVLWRIAIATGHGTHSPVRQRGKAADNEPSPSGVAHTPAAPHLAGV